MKKISPEEAQAIIALFEGRNVSLKEAAQIERTNRQRNRMLVQTFGLTEAEATTLLSNKEKVKELAQRLKADFDSSVQAKVRQIEAAALEKMRDPMRTRHLRGLLAPR